MAKKILFIEDEPDQIMLIQTRLESRGFEFISALDGEDGLKKVEKEEPDLILLDVVMPKMDGLEVCRRLKKNPTIAKIPIIMITASGDKNIEQNCLAAGADTCVMKPYNSEDLVAKIKNLLNE